MLLGNLREDFHSHCGTSQSVPLLASSFSSNDSATTSLNSSSSTTSQNSIQSQQAIMNYARMSYRYTTVTLLSMRPPPGETNFPDHLIERRFLDDENYIDLDRMLTENAGNFRLEPCGVRNGAGDGPLIPTRIHKYDFSDPVAIEKVKSRRRTDSMTPHQVAALTSVATRHQSSIFPSPLSSPHSVQSSHPHIDNCSHRVKPPSRMNQRYREPRNISSHYQTQNSGQIDFPTNQIRPLLPEYPSHIQHNTAEFPILQRLFQAQQHQQRERCKTDVRHQHFSFLENNSVPRPENPNKNSPTFYHPTTIQSSNPYNTFTWPFSVEQHQKSDTFPLQIPISTLNCVRKNQDVLSQLINEQLRCSTSMEAAVSPTIATNGSNHIDGEDNEDDDDDQCFYSAPPSPTEQHSGAQISFNNSKGTEQERIYNQAVLLNSLIRNMVDVNKIKGSSSDESCSSGDTQSSNSKRSNDESYTEMYNLIRLLSPGVKSVAQQELLQYLEQGCLKAREEMLRLVAALDSNERNSLKPVLFRLINEQLDIMKNQQQIQQGHSTSVQQKNSTEPRSTLENWFGANIYSNAYPSMPEDRVISACELEQSRSIQ